MRSLEDVRVKRGSFGAKIRGCPCIEGKGSEGGAVGRPGNTACRERSLSLFGSYFFFSLSQSSPALRTASGSGAEMPQSLNGGSVSVSPGNIACRERSLSLFGSYFFFSLSQSSPALRTASGSDAEIPQSLSGGSVSVRPVLTLSGSESLSRLALYI